MLNFACKSLLFLRHWRHYGLRASPNYEFQQCLSSLSIRCMSTTQTPNQQSSTVPYLISTYGFTPKSALFVSNNFQLNKVDASISFFKSHGFSQTHISKIISSQPQMISMDPEKNLLPKMGFLYSKGFSSHDLANVLSKCPCLFRRSLEKHIIPNFNYLCDLFESQERAIVSIKHKPVLLYHDLQTYWAPQIDILLEYGVNKSSIFMSMHSWSYTAVIDRKVFKEVVEEVKEMGLDPLKPQFVLAISLKTAMSRSLWESKVNMYKKWGWSEEEFLEAFQKEPRIMTVSKDKIMGAMDFFVNQMNLKSSDIAKRPNLFQLSLQKRVIPRAAVFQFLLTNGLIKRKAATFNTLMVCTEKAFLQKIANSYDEAPRLLKLYKDKLNISQITKG